LSILFLSRQFWKPSDYVPLPPFTLPESREENSSPGSPFIVPVCIAFVLLRVIYHTSLAKKTKVVQGDNAMHEERRATIILRCQGWFRQPQPL